MFLTISEDIINVLQPLKVKLPRKRNKNEQQWQVYAPFNLGVGEPLNVCFKTKGELNPETTYWVIVQPQTGNRGGKVGSGDVGNGSNWGGHWEIRIYPAKPAQEEIRTYSRLELSLTNVAPGPVSQIWRLNNDGCLYTVSEREQSKELRVKVENSVVNQILSQCDYVIDPAGQVVHETGEFNAGWFYYHFPELGIKIYDNRVKGKNQEHCVLLKFFDDESGDKFLRLYDDELKKQIEPQGALLSFEKVGHLEVLENQAYYFQNFDGCFLALTDEYHSISFVNKGQKITLASEKESETITRRKNEFKGIQVSGRDWVNVLLTRGHEFYARYPGAPRLSDEEIFAIEVELTQLEGEFYANSKRWDRKNRLGVQSALLRREMEIKKACEELERIKFRGQFSPEGGVTVEDLRTGH